GARAVEGALRRGGRDPRDAPGGGRGLPPRAHRVRGPAAGWHAARPGERAVRVAGRAHDRSAGPQARVPAAVQEGVRARGGPGGTAAGGDAPGGTDRSVGGVIPSAARDLAREWLEVGEEDPSSL